MVKFFLSFSPPGQSTQVIQLPVPPPEYGVDSPWMNQQTGSQLPDPLYQPMNLIGINGLRTITISSFFPIQGHNYPWLQNTSMWGLEYVNKIGSWRAQRYPIRLVVVGSTDHDVNMLVTIDDFQTKVQKDGDISYTMTMTEYVMPKVS